MTWLPPSVAPLVLLLFSNIFMTFAWDGHFKFTAPPLWLAIVASWGIALNGRDDRHFPCVIAAG